MKTGRYRIRQGWFGKAILQEEHNSPSFIGGHVDASVRSLNWYDVRFDDMSHVVFLAISQHLSQSAEREGVGE